MAADAGVRRAVADRGRRPPAAAAVRRAARGVGPDAREAAQRQDRDLHLGDADARRRLLRAGDQRGAQARRAHRRRPRADVADDAACRGSASTSAARSTTASRRSSTSPATCRRPAATGSATAQLDEIAELVDAADGRTLGLFSSRRAAETAAEAIRERLPHLTTLAQGDAQLPELAKQFVERPAHLPVRHPQPVAGARRAGRDLPAGADRPDPVPATRRPADERPPAGRRPGRRQRLHAGRGHPRRAAARPGLRPADPHDHRPRRGRRARPAAGDGPLRQLPQGQPAADVDRPPTRRSSARRWPGWRRPRRSASREP